MTTDKYNKIHSLWGIKESDTVMITRSITEEEENKYGWQAWCHEDSFGLDSMDAYIGKTDEVVENIEGHSSYPGFMLKQGIYIFPAIVLRKIKTNK